MRRRRYVITTGDVDGIGLEVTYKALLKLKLPNNVQLFVFEPLDIAAPVRRLRTVLMKRRRCLEFRVGLDLQKIMNAANAQIVFLRSPLSPAIWVEQAARLCLSEYFSAMITAPLSKTLIKKSGYNAVGHTEILKGVAKSGPLNMCFLGQHFHVLLATGHLSLEKVSRALNTATLKTAIVRADQIARLLKIKKPIALVGLNPHAGEAGLIGKNELGPFKSALSWAKKKKIQIVGPLVPDAAFLRKNWSRFSIFVCPYHDQGLIPFKLVHGADDGAHITLGLPFVRTSVDHGTAKDIFGKNRANPNSMLCALDWALRLSR